MPDRSSNHRIAGEHSRSEGAFTALELLIGMAITALVALALGSTMTTVAQGWNVSEKRQGEALNQHTAMLRLERLISSSKQVLVHSSGSLDGVGSESSVILWVEDAPPYGTTPEMCELAVISHVRSENTLYLYQFTVRTPGINDQAVLLPDMADLLSTLFGMNSVTMDYYGVRRRPLATDVSQAYFNAQSPVAGGRPAVEFVLTTSDGRNICGTATLAAGQ